MLDTETAQGYALLTDLAYAVDRPDIAVAASRRAVYDDVVFGEDAYPVVAMPTADVRPEQALLHALIRQESGFDRDAVSSAGARGLMQLMPATAETVAGGLGIEHSTGRLTVDPLHNIRLGSTYLAQRLERFWRQLRRCGRGLQRRLRPGRPLAGGAGRPRAAAGSSSTG